MHKMFYNVYDELETNFKFEFLKEDDQFAYYILREEETNFEVLQATFDSQFTT